MKTKLTRAISTHATAASTKRPQQEAVRAAAVVGADETVVVVAEAETIAMVEEPPTVTAVRLVIEVVDAAVDVDVVEIRTKIATVTMIVTASQRNQDHGTTMISA